MGICSTCNGKGYIESAHAKDSIYYPSMRRCPTAGCPHEAVFHKEVANRYAKVEEPDTDKSPSHRTCIHGNSINEDDLSVDKRESELMPVVEYVCPKVDLPAGFEESYDKLKEESEDAVILISTSIGKCIVREVDDAYRVMIIVDKYVQHGELLDWCGQFDNVIIFPLPRRLKAV